MKELKLDHDLSADPRVRLARRAHKGQTDKTGHDYFEAHLLPVARSFPVDLFYAALAHDILDDTLTTVEDLGNAGFSACEINLIELLTKTGKDDFVYLERIANNRDAKIIKVMDIASNLSRMGNIDEKGTRTRLITKYLEALRHLM